MWRSHAWYYNITDIRIDNAYIESNKGSALCFIDANVSFSGETRLFRNTGKQGGGVYSQRSAISFMDPQNTLYSNYAATGGAIYSVNSKITFSVNTLLQANKASTDGGALYALGTDIVLSNRTKFTRNSANRGGAMYFEQASVMFDTYSRTYTTHNYAEWRCDIQQTTETSPHVLSAVMKTQMNSHIFPTASLASIHEICDRIPSESTHTMILLRRMACFSLEACLIDVKIMRE